jgi:hypothetical protein
LDAESLEIDRRFDQIVGALKYSVVAADGGLVASPIDNDCPEDRSVNVPALRAAAAVGGVLSVLLLGLVSQLSWFEQLGNGWRVLVAGTWLVILTPMIALCSAMAVGRLARTTTKD